VGAAALEAAEGLVLAARRESGSNRPSSGEMLKCGEEFFARMESQMANRSISEFVQIESENLANEDLVPVVDVSSGSADAGNKSISVEELRISMQGDLQSQIDNKASASAVDVALALKAPINNPSFTGTVSGVTKSMVGLSNADNTSDADKPISTEQGAALATKAPLASPALTGTPTAPVPAPGTNTQQIAVTSWVKSSVDLLAGVLSARITSEAELCAYADAVLSGRIDVETTDRIAADAVLSGRIDVETTDRIAADAVLSGRIDVEATDRIAADLLKAPLASPALTGTPTVPTATPGTATTQAASTAFVDAARAILAAAISAETDARADADIALTDALTLKAPLDSPIFTGIVGGIDAAMLAEAPAAKILTATERAAISHLDTHRDRVGEAVLAARDPQGRFVGFDAAGRAVATGLDVRQSLDRDALTEATTLVSSATGAPVLQFDAAGRLAGEYASAPAATTRDAIYEAEPIIKAAGGTSLMVGREDGLDIAHSGLWRDRLAGDIAANPPAFDRAGRRAFNLRYGTSGFALATTQLADGYVGDIVQLRGRTTAIPYSPAPLVALHVTGQSNAGAGPGPVGTPPVTGVLAQDHVLRTDVDDYSSGSTEEVPGAATDFVSASEPRLANQAQSPAAMQAYGIWMLGRRAGRECPGILLSTAWQGGQTIDKFFPGAYPAVSGSESPLYENLYAHVVNAARVADQVYGRAVEHNIVWVQGEGDTDYASYLSQMQLWLSTVLPTFDAITSGAVRPHFFLFQTQTGTAAEVAETGSGTAQLKVARDNLGAGVTMIGPMYQGAVHDNIHHDNLARMMMGELMALAHEWVRVKATPFNPLWPVAGGVTRSGATITIPMVLPPGTTALSFDADWVAAIANKGFWYADDSGSPPAITSVAISGTSIVITLAAVPGGANKRVGYGTKKLTETPGWASSRGQLYADSGLRSPYAALGHAVPQTIRHYCVRFMETLA
jgi:hypothetical protein